MLYKYRSLDNFQFILDILVNQRLYATSFDEMNDPMEGHYTHSNNMTPEIIGDFDRYYKEIKICSLSKEKNEPLMWAHYADGARGIVIGVELEKSTDFREVKYDGPSFLLANKASSKERAKNVLRYKK
ncbi:hypothetical protein [Aliikangiella sp. G2MR2-5]|uniref:hypothetical protein n=1 Tax=Aliikangiella sp. G2MR2-5 TaxID=2788943 RepID=UPI0018AB6532|nr:hypothetical protein [Aliikangiella sp. G2MR2-5]